MAALEDAQQVALRYAKARQPEMAAQWLAKMEMDGVKPDAISYSCVINAFGKCSTSGS